MAFRRNEMRDVLCFADTFVEFSSSMEYSARLAGTLAGRLTGVFVCPPAMGAMPPCDAPQIASLLIEETRELEEQAETAGPRFERRAIELGARKAAWQIAEGYVPNVLAHLGNWHDLLVLGRDERQPWSTPPMLGGIVLGSRLPCIVVPPGESVPALDTIVVAWNSSQEAVRAIHAALPLLARAKRVVVLRGRPREQFSEIGWRPEFDLGRYFDRAEIVAEYRPFDVGGEDAGVRLLEAAAAERADLLVMGAYGRTRFSEWVFGGATRLVLAESRLPVFMRH
jgi:nucleotide-binding universal stress UspA family protein